MTVFRTSKSRKPSLVIVDDQDDSDQEGLILPVYPPIIGDFATSWDELIIPINLSTWSTETTQGDLKMVFLHGSHHRDASRTQPYSSLGRRIIAGEAKWDTSFKIHGEFSYTPLYWEWLEDTLSRCKDLLISSQMYDAVYASLFLYDRNANVFRAFLESWSPTTNTLHISVGEMSISLWDLRLIGGLPIKGLFYEEVIPSAEEIVGTSEKKRPFLPRSCQYLFAAFHHLGRKKEKKNDKVTIEDWIKFWYTGPGKYHRSSRKASTHKPRYPSGKIPSSQPWSGKDEDTFSTLGIERAWKKETYLAALLSCWLCVFALPQGNFIRPGTFKIASLMASGDVVSLAIPVLAIIYRGLREFSNSTLPGRCKAHLPAHYIYAWLGRFFETHHPAVIQANGPLMVRLSGEGVAITFQELEARELIRSGQNISWCSNTYKCNRDFIMQDHGNLSSSQFSYFVSLRSSYLSFRHDGNCFVEPYSPHRFCRQFGFYQDIPGDLIESTWGGSLHELCQFYWTCLQFNTGSSVLIPAYTTDYGERVTPRYDAWWHGINGDYFTIGTKALVNGISKLPQEAPKKTTKLRIVHGPPKALVSECDGEAPSNAKKIGDQSPLVAGVPLGPQLNVDFQRLRSVIVINDQNNSLLPVEENYKEENDPGRKRTETQLDSLPITNNCVAGEILDCDDPSDECNWKHKSKRSKFDHHPSTVLEELQIPNYVELTEYGDNIGTPLGSPYVLPTDAELSVAARTLHDYLGDKANDAGNEQKFEVDDVEEVTSHNKDISSPRNFSDKRVPVSALEVSVFHADQKILEISFNASLELGKCLLNRLSGLPFSLVLDFKKTADLFCQDIDKINVIDSSGIRMIIKDYMESVKRYLSSKNLSNQRITLGQRDKRLEEVALELSAARFAENNSEEHVQSLHTNLQNVQSRIVELQKELQSLEGREQELKTSIFEKEMEKAKDAEMVLCLEKQHVDLRDASIIADTELESLEILENLVKNMRVELKDLQWWK